QSGRMYFGGVNGITAFYPKEIQATTIAPKVEITDFWVNGKILNTGSFSKNAMNLEYEQNQVTFKFAAMDFAAPQHNRYKHRLLGVDAQWTFPSTSNSAAYVHLSPGTYVFEVMTGGSKGIWNGEPARFEFTILPPWWQTWPAYALYFLAIVSLIWAIIHFQVNKIRLENKLKFEQKEAERLAGLDKIKTDFFSGVTHEFRTPITLILEPIRQLKKRLEKEEDIETAEMIERNSERLLTYVNQLLDLSKLEAGQMPLDLRFCDPVELTNLAIKQFGSAFADRDIHLNLNLPESSSLIYLDESKWTQILNNLVSNAIKFSHKGGQITVSLSLTHQQFNATRMLQLIVSDEGIGIQPEDLPRVFDRFFQAKHGKGGSGIGLALTQELVEKMEGSISVESEVGKGASFKVVVPCSVWNGSVDQSAPMHAAVNPAAMIEKVYVDELQTNHTTIGQPGTEPYLILLVEDEPEIRTFIASTLPSDFRVAEAGDGEAGLKLAMELVPDIIISDVAMPVKDGFEMTRSLKQNNITSHIPVILLTAKTSHESKMVGLESGADAYLSKPFRTEELIQVVRNLLNARLKWQSFYAQHPVHTSAGQPPIDSPAEEHNFIKQLKAVIDLNLDKESMDADAFARAVFLSRSQLHRKLTALTGLSLSEFVRNYRLDRAREILLHQNATVAEAAWQTGFQNTKYFSTCFKERFGVSPSEVKSSA
ncbi:MAG: response regulator, partial [Saprospiraceae bacterium]|nr:response regulator [Saprospiraceae bacterium]